MTINQRKKGHDFERKVAKMLQEDLGLIKPIRRILNQYQEKNHPDLKLAGGILNARHTKKVLNLLQHGGNRCLELLVKARYQY